MQKYGYIDLSENALVLNKKNSTLWHRSDKPISTDNQDNIIKIETTKPVYCMIVKFYFSVGNARKVVFVGRGGAEMLSCGNI